MGPHKEDYQILLLPTSSLSFSCIDEGMRKHYTKRKSIYLYVSLGEFQKVRMLVLTVPVETVR